MLSQHKKEKIILIISIEMNDNIAVIVYHINSRTGSDNQRWKINNTPDDINVV